MQREVLIAAPVDPALLQRVGADQRFTVVYHPSTTEADLLEHVGTARILITRYHNPVTRTLLEQASALELIVQGTTGLDNIDLDAAAARGITVIGTPGENANAVAELVLAQMIALTRTLPLYDRMVRNGAWARDDCASRRELRSHRIGIVGLGRVGTRVANLTRAFGAEPCAVDPYVPEDEMFRRGARGATLEELLETSDILTLHVPLTAETRQMIGGAQLDHLPPGAVVINTSRGEVLDTPAALDRLGTGHLAGLALDVFEEEPPGRDWPDHPGLLLTPHIAGCSREAKSAIGRLIYERICAFYSLPPLSEGVAE